MLTVRELVSVAAIALFIVSMKRRLVLLKLLLANR